MFRMKQPGAMPFEKSPADAESKGMKEGSKKEEGYDNKQGQMMAKKMPATMGKGLPAPTKSRGFAPRKAY